MNLSTRQWEIAAGEESASVLFNGIVKCKNIGFMDYDADTDTCQIQDRDGHVVWNGNGHSDLSPVMSEDIGRFNGLIVPVLTSGRVVIYTE